MFFDCLNTKVFFKAFDHAQPMTVLQSGNLKCHDYYFGIIIFLIISIKKIVHVWQIFFLDSDSPKTTSFLRDCVSTLP